MFAVHFISVIETIDPIILDKTIAECLERQKIGQFDGDFVICLTEAPFFSGKQTNRSHTFIFKVAFNAIMFIWQRTTILDLFIIFFETISKTIEKLM
jgi:hypothetical protein